MSSKIYWTKVSEAVTSIDICDEANDLPDEHFKQIVNNYSETELLRLIKCADETYTKLKSEREKRERKELLDAKNRVLETIKEFHQQYPNAALDLSAEGYRSYIYMEV